MVTLVRDPSARLKAGRAAQWTAASQSFTQNWPVWRAPGARCGL